MQWKWKELAWIACEPDQWIPWLDFDPPPDRYRFLLDVADWLEAQRASLPSSRRGEILVQDIRSLRENLDWHVRQAGVRLGEPSISIPPLWDSHSNNWVVPPTPRVPGSFAPYLRGHVPGYREARPQVRRAAVRVADEVDASGPEGPGVHPARPSSSQGLHPQKRRQGTSASQVAAEFGTAEGILDRFRREIERSAAAYLYEFGSAPVDDAISRAAYDVTVRVPSHIPRDQAHRFVPYARRSIKNAVLKVQEKTAEQARFETLMEQEDLDRAFVSGSAMSDPAIGMIVRDAIRSSSFPEVVLLSAAGYELKEIAERLGRPLERVKKQAQRSRRQVRNYLFSEGDLLDHGVVL